MSERWAVLIGIDSYHESLGPLKYSVNDCKRLAEVLTSGDDAFPAGHVLMLADSEDAERKPTYANIHSWLASWLGQANEDDTVLVFFAGHGREMDGNCYLVPGDATLQSIHVTGILVPYLQELLNRCKARQKMLIVDACHSGAGRDVSTMAAPMMETLSTGKGIYTLTSCDVDELSYEWEEKQQGVFSYYLADAFAGNCPPDSEGCVTAEGLYQFVYSRVRDWARTHRCEQAPQRISQGSGALVLRRPLSPATPPSLETLPPDAQVDLDTARKLLHQKKLGDAYAAAQEGLRKEPASYDLDRLRREIEEALREESEKNEAAAKKQAKARFRKLLRDAKRYEKDGDLSAAMRCLDEASKYVEDGVGNPLIESLRTRMEVRTHSKAQQLKHIFARAAEVETEEPELALNLYREALRIYPGNRRAQEAAQRCKSLAELQTMCARIATAHEDATRNRRDILASLRHLKARMKEYEELAMDEESDKVKQEIQQYQSAKTEGAELLSFLKGVSQAFEEAGTLEEARISAGENATVRRAAREILLNKYDCDTSLIRGVMPGILSAYDKLQKWTDRVERAIEMAKEKRKELLRAHEQQVDKEKTRADLLNTKRREEYERAVQQENQRVQNKNARLSSDHERLNWIARLAKKRPTEVKPKVMSPEVVKPERTKKPDCSGLVNWPSLPEGCAFFFGDKCLDFVPDSAPKWVGLDAFRDEIQKELGIRTRRTPGKSIKKKTKTKAATVSRTKRRTGSFEEWLSRQMRTKQSNAAGCIERMKDALIRTLVKKERVRVANFGTFCGSQGIVELRYSSTTKSSSQGIWDAFRSCGWNNKAVNRSHKAWALIPKYCKNTGNEVRIQGVGKFWTDEKGQLQFSPSRVLGKRT